MDAGVAAYRRGDYPGAGAAFERALGALNRTPETDGRLPVTLEWLAGARQEERRDAEAESLYRRALALRERARGADDPGLTPSLEGVAGLVESRGRLAEAEPLRRRVLAIEEKARGPEHPKVAVALNNLAGVYLAQGRYSEVEPLALRMLAIQDKALGPDHPDLATALNNVAGLYHSQGRHAEAEPLYRRSLALSERHRGPAHPEVATTLANLAGLHLAQGRYREAAPLYGRALAIREQALGPQHPDVAATLSDMAALARAEGRYAEAEARLARALAVQEAALGREHHAVAVTLNNLAALNELQGRYAEAESLHLRALALREKALGPTHPAVATTLSNLATLYRAQGRYAEAEPLYRRALTVKENALGPDHPATAVTLNNLAGLYRAQGRTGEAEALYRRDLAISEKALGPDHPELATTLNNLAGLAEDEGRAAEAEPLYRRALAIQDKVLGPDHPDLATTLNNLAALYRRQGRIAEADPLYRRALAIEEKTLGSGHPHVAVMLNNLAALEESRGRPREAESLYRRALALQEAALGPAHPAVATTLGNLAALHRAEGRLPAALGAARRGTQIAAARVTDSSAPGRQATLTEQRTRSAEFEQHVALLAAAQAAGIEPEAKLVAESFEVAQLARVSSTAGQLARMAARHAAGTGRLAQLARARQDLLLRWEGLDEILLAGLGRPGAGRDPARESQLRGEQDRVRREIGDLDARLDAEFPRYRELTDPRPLGLDAARALLAEDEALVALLATPDESFVWVVRSDRAAFARSGPGGRELSAMVRRLRMQLDLGAADPERVLSRPFDVALAHELYRRLLGPLEAVLEGAKHLVVVPDGALQSLPFSVLVTAPGAEPPRSLADHADVAWLARRFAVTTLPAAASLHALRSFAKPAAAPRSFAGFGDPLLDGPAGAGRGTGPARTQTRAPAAAAEEIRTLPRLPETATELKALASILNADAGDVHLGREATETRVKATDLARFRTLAFATHGLVAGEFAGVAEPALVLTPPAVPTASDDGLLTAGEISQLKLDADWVILSACNTAAPDGTPGAEGLSGLARAFFYAGARTLVVSHWAVDSEAAMALTTRMFEEAAQGRPKAEALRRSMLSVMNTAERPRFAHPAFWAPFAVVGKGWAAESRASSGSGSGSREPGQRRAMGIHSGPWTGKSLPTAPTSMGSAGWRSPPPRD